MLRWLLPTLLVVVRCSAQQDKLDGINFKIAEVEAKVLHLAELREARYEGQGNIPLGPKHNKVPPEPTVDSQRRQYFNQQLSSLLSMDSGIKSFLLVVRQELFFVECFPRFAVVFDMEGSKLAQLPHRISQYSYIKSPGQPLVAFLTYDNVVLLCNSDSNLTECSNIALKSQLAAEEVVGLYVYKHEGRHIISLFTESGRIHIYNEDGEERSLVKTRHRNILKLIDHSPYPIIIGTQSLSVFEPVRTLELEMGCPMMESEVVDAASESSLSGNLYVLLRSGEVLVHTYSLKKHDKECKVTGKLELSYQPSRLQVFYPLVLMNNTFVNTSDSVMGKQLLLPLSLCANNTFQSAYRKSEYYLLHRCCTGDSCRSFLYRRDKPQSSSSKMYKFGVFIVLILVVSFRIFGKSVAKDTATAKVEQDEISKNGEEARLQRLVEMLDREGPKHASKQPKPKKQ